MSLKICTIPNQMADKYEVIDRIGVGGFSVVYKGINILTNEIVALKRVRIEANPDGVPSSVIREVSLLKELDHVNVVRLLDVMTSENYVTLVLEHLDLDLKEYIKKHLSAANRPSLIKNFLYQILLGVHYCHSHKVVHRDLKPSNILVDANKSIVKVSDFGLARAFGVPPRTHTAMMGTLGYRSPEIVLGRGQYSTQGDVWAVGCIFAEMVRGKALFPGVGDLYKIFGVLGKPSGDWSGQNDLLHQWSSIKSHLRNQDRSVLADKVKGLEDDGYDLLSKMLCMDPNARITVPEALKHPYFNDVQKAT